MKFEKPYRSQLSKLLKQCAVKSELKMLAFHSVKLKGVASTVFARGICNIEKVVLDCGNNKTEWIEEMYREMFETIGETSKLKYLELHSQDLTFVDPIALALGVNKLENVVLSNCFLENVQPEEILQQILRKTNLKKLNI